MGFSTTISEYAAKQFVKNKLITSLFGITITATGIDADTTYLIGNGTTFIDSGVIVGDLITMDVGGETATVENMISNTQMYTSILSGSGTYASAEVFYIFRGDSKIRSGTNDATSSTTELNFAAGTFVFDKIVAGDLVRNITEGVTATVVSVDSQIKLTTTAVTDWTGDSFVIFRPANTTFIMQGAVAATDPKTIVLINETASFITDGVIVGDLVTNTTDSQTATVISVDSETSLRTTTLTGAADFDAADNFTVLPVSPSLTFRAVLYPTTNSTVLLRQIMGVTDGASAITRQIRVHFGNNGAQEFMVPLPTGLFGFDPDLHQSIKGQPIIIDMEVATAAGSALDISYEWR